MSGQYREINICLYRDAFTTPWGFRLQGGRDFKGPLTVQRVFVGSPADGELSRGDVITLIERQSAEHITHRQAQDIIKATGGTLELSVRRGQRSGAPATQSTPKLNPQTFRSQGLDTFTPKPAPQLGAFSPTKSPGSQTELGTDFGSLIRPVRKAPEGAMLNRVQQSLNTAIWTGQPEDDYEYQQRSIGDLKHAFSGPTHLTTTYKPPTQRSSRPQHKWHKPSGGYGNVPPGLTEPGWSPNKQTEMGWSPSPNRAPAAPRGVYVPQHPGPPQQSYLEQQKRPAPPPVNRPGPGAHARERPIQHFDEGPPAWAGSLRGSGGSKPWEVHAAAAALDGPTMQGPSSPRQPQQPQQPMQNASQGSAFQPHTPRVQNAHYGPGATAPQYQQHSPGAHQNSDTAKVAHLQYNSPLQLYSKSNAQDVLQGQTGGGPGEGTMAITGGAGGQPGWDISKSETYRLIHESERGGPRSARNIDHAPGQEMHYQGYQDQKKQSPSMQALQHFVAADPAGHQSSQKQPQPASAPAPAPPMQAQPVGGGGGGGGDESTTGYSDF